MNEADNSRNMKQVESGVHCSFPDSLSEALQVRKEHPELIPYAGGTDLMVDAAEDAGYLFLNRIPEIKQITQDDEYIRFGAACTFTEVIDSPLTPGILREACLQIAAPAIRNVGSIGGNIGNGSPKADSALIFIVTNSLIRLANADGERVIPVRQFYLGRKNLALAPDELIAEVLMPKHGIDNYYYKKVGARKALAISRAAFAGIMDIRDEIIINCAAAFGSIGDVIICREDIDGMLIGKSIEEASELKKAYIDAYDSAIVPTAGRVSADYRKDVCMNLLRDFLESNEI